MVFRIYDWLLLYNLEIKMISACFTNYNRTDLLFEALKPFIEHDFISEIVIVDDHSVQEVMAQVFEFTQQHKKICLYRNEKNLDCYLNKREAVSKARNEWVMILDSDNIFSKEYIDRAESLYVAGLNPRTAYQPSFAMPHFDFTRYEGVNVSKANIKAYIKDATFQTMLNAFNYFVNRDEFLKVFDASVDPVTSDSIFHNYNWLKAGNSIYVVPTFTYQHRVHEESHYRNNVRRTPRNFHEEVVSNLMKLA